MKNVSQENSDGETVQKKNMTNDFSNLTEADLIPYSNVNENIQESLDDLEPPNTEEETPSTSKVHQKKSKWLVH